MCQGVWLGENWLIEWLIHLFNMYLLGAFSVSHCFGHKRLQSEQNQIPCLPSPNTVSSVVGEIGIYQTITQMCTSNLR